MPCLVRVGVRVRIRVRVGIRARATARAGARVWVRIDAMPVRVARVVAVEAGGSIVARHYYDLLCRHAWFERRRRGRW